MRGRGVVVFTGRWVEAQQYPWQVVCPVVCRAAGQSTSLQGGNGRIPLNHWTAGGRLLSRHDGCWAGCTRRPTGRRWTGRCGLMWWPPGHQICTVHTHPWNRAFTLGCPSKLVSIWNNRNWNRNQFWHGPKQNVCFGCFGSIPKQRVLLFRLNRFTKFRVVSVFSVCFCLFLNSLFRLFRFYTEKESFDVSI